MRSYVTYGFLLALVGAVAADNCTVAPLVLTIGNNTLSADGIALNRGIACSIGGQTQGLRMNFNRNNTSLRNTRDCDNNSTTRASQCRGASGGVFDLTQSTSWTAVTTNDWNVTSIDPASNGATGTHVVRGYDTAVFGRGVRVPHLPIEVWSDTTSQNRSALGFGKNSSVLSTFLEDGVVPSSEIGLFLGSRSMSFPNDGELVVGGYNSGRVNGSFTDFPINTNYDLAEPCPLKVLLKDVYVTDKNGTKRSIMPDSGARIPACINPIDNAFQFTPTMFSAWSNATRRPSNPPADGSKNFTDQTYPLDREEYMDTLTISLEGGYESTIPHYELVGFERGNDAQGLYAVVNTSRVQSAVTNAGTFGFPVLGGVFLSQNYLKVDYNRGFFSLARAITGPIPSRSNNITSLCSGNTTVYVPPRNTTVPTPEPTPSGKLGGGAIAGIVIGSIAGLAAIGALVFFLFLKRSPVPELDDTPASMHDVSDSGAPDAGGWGSISTSREAPKYVSEMPS